jgi:uncharacterized SAM-binding protein YcdF (DUF218 family)
MRTAPRLANRKGCGCGCPVLLLVAAVLLVVVFYVPLLTALGSYLVNEEPPVKADAAVVLGGDEFGLRTLKAAELVKQGFVPYALLSGPAMLISNEGEMMQEFAVQKGYPASFFQQSIHGANSTHDEVEALAEDLKKRGVHKILLVTSNYHTRRAASLFRHAAPWLEIHPVAAPDEYFTPGGWWQTRRGRKTFVLEWMKTVATWAGQ